ncbi:MAG TPA: hypothetical protein VGD83_11400, partial [Streptosporangiaceae bacterium]
MPGTSGTWLFLGWCTWRGTSPGGSIGKEPRYREVAMKPPPFAYAAPATLEEAVGLLTEHA